MAFPDAVKNVKDKKKGKKGGKPNPFAKGKKGKPEDEDGMKKGKKC